MTRCHDLLDASSHTETKFTALLKSCSHPQFLDQNVVNKVRGGVAALNQVKTQLSKEMKSGHPDQRKVRLSLFILLGKLIVTTCTCVHHMYTLNCSAIRLHKHQWSMCCACKHQSNKHLHPPFPIHVCIVQTHFNLSPSPPPPPPPPPTELTAGGPVLCPADCR